MDVIDEHDGHNDKAFGTKVRAQWGVFRVGEDGLPDAGMLPVFDDEP